MGQLVIVGARRRVGVSWRRVIELGSKDVEGGEDEIVICEGIRVEGREASGVGSS